MHFEIINIVPNGDVHSESMRNDLLFIHIKLNRRCAQKNKTRFHFKRFCPTVDT